MAPTKTLPLAISRLVGRQTTATVTAVTTASGSTSNSGLDGGAIAGIVIGTVVGILLLWWIIRACTQPRAADANNQGWYDDTPRARSRSRSHGRHHHHHHHSSRHHSRRRSSTSRPVVLEEKVAYAPRRPSATYVYPEGRSRSRSAGRYYTTTS
jgi:ABC-type nickel/cobalt efflux system permease component RcnA